ncbi:MAG: aldehyde dehydrogenase family protein, partial [SAR324 cluster bacterium]|nr:aldehyde dehydrogenase family protein [SAR324 cluster bacterium]
MANAKFNLSLPSNEPIRSYAPGTPERKDIKAKLKELKARQIEIPVIIGGKEVKTGNMGKCILPHDHGTAVGTYHKAGEKEVQKAIEVSLRTRSQWAEMDWQNRASIFLRAADFLAGPWRSLLNAASMLCQSKNVFQAEVDAACELIDFLRFNAFYA